METATMALPSVSLKFQEGNSDKEYHAQILEKEDGYVVVFQYGRAGGTMNPGTKTVTPVDLDKATKIFDKLVAEKVGKGYREAGAATALTQLVESLDSGKRPQLLNAIDESEARQLLADDDFVAQEKMDGKRIMLTIQEGIVTANNKLGLTCSISPAVVQAAQRLPIRDAVVDGEMIGDVFYVFDILSLQGQDVSKFAYVKRHAHYQELLDVAANLGITELVAVPAFFTKESKTALFNRVKQAHGEGVVFKRAANSAYKPGRPNSGGDQLKFKFTESCSCIIDRIHDSKRSVGLALLGANGDRINVGNVTVPPNQSIPSLNSVVEVRFLHMFEAGSLFQPVLIGARDDVTHLECSIKQVRRIKSKTSDADE